MDKERTELFVCSCNSLEHQFVVSWLDNSEYPDDEDELFVTVHLAQSMSFWGKLKNALRYLFSRWRCRFGDFDEILLKKEDAVRLRDTIDKWLKEIEENKKAQKLANEALQPKESGRAIADKQYLESFSKCLAEGPVSTIDYFKDRFGKDLEEVPSFELPNLEASEKEAIDNAWDAFFEKFKAYEESPSDETWKEVQLLFDEYKRVVEAEFAKNQENRKIFSHEEVSVQSGQN